MYKVDDIASWFICLNKENLVNGDDVISNIKLQELLYYAQGSYLALRDEPLFEEELLKCGNSVIVKSVFAKYKSFQYNGAYLKKSFNTNLIDFWTTNILKQVYKEFGQFSSWKLRKMIREELPYKKALEDSAISKKELKQYFKQKYIK